MTPVNGVPFDGQQCNYQCNKFEFNERINTRLRPQL